MSWLNFVHRDLCSCPYIKLLSKKNHKINPLRRVFFSHS
nr:MAG TPA: hypothetical protein [Caudoviricetes sp.]